MKREQGSTDSPAFSWPTTIAAVLVLFAPIFVLVARSPRETTENRTPTRYVGRDAGWDYFDAFGDYMADRLPLKTSAIRADAWVDENVFREDPAFGGAATPRVIRGADGFLFLADAVDNACGPHAPPESTVANLAELASIIEASGREVLTMVAPDKSSVHPELLPDDMSKRECFDAYTAALWSDLANADIDGYVDLRSALIAASTRSREPLYFRQDTHWDTAGSLVAVQAMVDYLAPGLWTDDEVIYAGLTRYVGDLAAMQGTSDEDDTPTYLIGRPDVVNVSVEQLDDLGGGFNRRYISEAPEGRLIEGRTVMFYDSFGIAALHQIVPFFEDLTVIGLTEFDATRYVQQIEAADRVWIMSVERGLSWRLENEIGSRDFLDLLRDNLSQRS